MRKDFRILLIGFSLIIIVIGFYLYKLHALAVEGNVLFEYRCLHVNPPLISYKNAFLKYADYLNTYPNTKYTSEEVKGFIDEYISEMKVYQRKRQSKKKFSLGNIHKMPGSDL